MGAQRSASNGIGPQHGYIVHEKPTPSSLGSSLHGVLANGIIKLAISFSKNFTKTCVSQSGMRMPFP